MTSAQLLGPVEVRALAEQLSLQPTKRLGQNFVHDPNTVRRIVRAAQVSPDDVVLEVGPGLGSLTLALLPAVAHVHAVEIDPLLAAQLPSTAADRAPGLADRLTVTEADALRLRAADLPGPAPTALVANLPYNVGVPVVLHLLAELPGLRCGLVMVQAEVAQRMAAPPGSRAYGAPSAKLAWYASARRAGPVPRAVFWPVPNVDSELLAFTRRSPPAATSRAASREPACATAMPEVAAGESACVEATSGAAAPGESVSRESVSREATFRLIDAAFAQRRKSLRSGLAGWAGSPAAAETALRAAGIDPMARAETLGITEFARLAATGPT